MGRPAGLLPRSRTRRRPPRIQRALPAPQGMHRDRPPPPQQGRRRPQNSAGRGHPTPGRRGHGLYALHGGRRLRRTHVHLPLLLRRRVRRRLLPAVHQLAARRRTAGSVRVGGRRRSGEARVRLHHHGGEEGQPGLAVRAQCHRGRGTPGHPQRGRVHRFLGECQLCRGGSLGDFLFRMKERRRESRRGRSSSAWDVAREIK
mmetsp:Transcript_19398/g.44190  ORF Transcript_19398/g.44190 Transcript_19398/m.44190 type:complete len:202 (-) Transcript_19398:117-722(-)